ncbi:MAG: hypothetical protein IPP72_04665 [Chitinophagaceae bacterium]|nr:hypothetical protein [Chitinophagaceae bacterium]
MRKTSNTVLVTAIALLLMTGKQSTAQGKHDFTLKQTLDYGLQNAVQVKKCTAGY